MNLNNYIDHTLLKATATKAAIKQLCKEAIEYQFFSVCVNGCNVKTASKLVKKTPVSVCAVIGFPLGAMTTKAKVFEAKDAIKNGADEIDVVLNIGFLKSKQYRAVYKDIKSIKKAIGKKVLKVILETCYLDKSEIKKACELSVKAGADYVKTSTGFGTKGATIEDVQIMIDAVVGKAKIKASGGIKDAETAQKFINLGVHRLGVSAGIAIVTGKPSSASY